MYDPDVPVLVEVLPDFGLLIGTSIERASDATSRECCGHIAEGAVAHTCVQHDAGSLYCDPCMRSHLNGHDGETDGRCANCDGVDGPLTEIVITSAPQTFWFVGGDDDYGMVNLEVVHWGALLCDLCKLVLPFADWTAT